MLLASAACWVDARQLCGVISVSLTEPRFVMRMGVQKPPVQGHLGSQTFKALSKEGDAKGGGGGGFENQHYWVNCGQLFGECSVFQDLRFQPAVLAWKWSADVEKVAVKLRRGGGEFFCRRPEEEAQIDE